MNSFARHLHWLLLLIVIVVFALSLRAFGAAGSSAGRAAIMRLDYLHTGNSSEELFSVDRIVIEPLPWPGNPNRPLDLNNLLV